MIQGAVIRKFLQAQIQTLINSSKRHRIAQSTFTDTLIRQLNWAQLNQLEQTHAHLLAQCQALSRQKTLTLLRSNSVSTDFILNVHAKLCLREASKLPTSANGIEFVQQISSRLQEELTFRNRILSDSHLIIHQFKLSFDTSIWRM